MPPFTNPNVDERWYPRETRFNCTFKVARLNANVLSFMPANTSLVAVTRRSCSVAVAIPDPDRIGTTSLTGVGG